MNRHAHPDLLRPRRRCGVVRGPRALTVGVLAATALLAATAGCATIPGSSAPAIIDSFAPKNPGGAVATPVPGILPVDLVRAFLAAGGHVDKKHEAARQFLTPEAGASWDDAGVTAIVLRADIVPIGAQSGDRLTFAIRGDRVGVLDTGGVFRPGEGRLDERIELKRVGGEWRIDDLPPGVIIEKSEFFSSFARRDLYFLDREGTSVVPDPRWTASYQSDLGFSLVNLLVTGPRGDLALGVKTTIPASVSVRPQDKDKEGRSGTVIDFQGLPAMSTQATSQFAAQVVWTLDSAKVPGPYRLQRDGAPIEERLSGGWTTSDVLSFRPPHAEQALGFALTPADGLVRLDAAGAGPAGGPWSAVRSGRSGTLSRDRAALAVVTGPADGRSDPSTELIAGSLTAAPSQLGRASTITTPTWAKDGALWTVMDGNRLVRIASPLDRPSVVNLDPGPLRALDGDVTDFKVDDTGTRVAVVAGKRLYVGVVTSKDGKPAVSSFSRIGQSLGSTITSVAWMDRATLIAGRDSSEGAAASISVDGAFTELLSQRNIVSPITEVATTGDRVYALDSRSVVSLETTADLANRYWHEVPGLAAIRAHPVAAG